MEERKEIVIIGTAYPFRGGLATFNERLARQFMAEGHRVEIITFTTQYPSVLFPGKTQLSNETAPTDLRIRRAVHSCNPLTWWKVGRELRKQRPDLVICCYWMAFFAPAFATIERIVKRNGHTKCLALVHNMIPHEPTILDKLFAPAFVRNTDGFVALSKSVVEDIRRVERSQKSEVRNQKSEVRNQKSEVRNQKSEVRNQKSEVRSQKSDVRGVLAIG